MMAEPGSGGPASVFPCPRSIPGFLLEPGWRHLRRGAGEFQCPAGRRGSRTVKVVPSSGVERTATVPPCASTICCDDEEPQPQPDGAVRCSVLAPRRKGSKSGRSSSGGNGRALVVHLQHAPLPPSSCSDEAHRRALRAVVQRVLPPGCPAAGPAGPRPTRPGSRPPPPAAPRARVAQPPAPPPPAGTARPGRTARGCMGMPPPSRPRVKSSRSEIIRPIRSALRDDAARRLHVRSRRRPRRAAARWPTAGWR